MKAARGAGPLVLIGGAEDKTGDCVVLREFVRLAGGARARVAVLTVASEYPEEVGAEYLAVFQRLGVKQVEILDAREREQATEPALVEAVEHATGVFFTGGDQLRITNLLGGSVADQALHRRHDEGLVLGGTSAGAAMMAANMILEGKSGATPRVGHVRIGPGMEFLHGVLVDQHFAQRGRSGRLLSALAQYPHQLGVGIDEDTALVLQGDEFEVIGSGAVAVFDAGCATHNDMLERHPCEHIALCNVRLHVLTAGFRFRLSDRQPVLEARPARAKRAVSKHHEA
jgi:cyanophycinase